MPCGMLAVNNGRVSQKAAEAIRASKQGQTVLKTLIAQTLNISEDGVYFMERGWGGSAEGGDMDFMTAQVTVRLKANGTVEYRDGADLSNKMRGKTLEEFKGKIDALIEQVGGMAIGQVLSERIRKVAKTVSKDVVRPNGVREIKFRI